MKTKINKEDKISTFLLGYGVSPDSINKLLDSGMDPKDLPDPHEFLLNREFLGTLYPSFNEGLLPFFKGDWSKYSDILTFKKAFRIYKQTERQSSKPGLESYLLHFTSDELMYSDQQRINQSYEANYSKIVERILVDYLKVY